MSVSIPRDRCTEDLGLIPWPVSVTPGRGHLHLTPGCRIAVSAGLAGEGELLGRVLRRSTGFPLPVEEGTPSTGDIALSLDSSPKWGEEGYGLAVDGQDASIRAATPAGVFYGCQTLRQLLPVEVESPHPVEGVDWTLPRVVIEDLPRFEWRGMMLDVARHFFPAGEVKRLIDLAAHHKLNRFHLHLTDDQGWRIETRSWPDLATVGGATAVGGGAGGSFSKADYREIVEYATARHVTVIPEIDMPGHCNAALVAYPVLNGDGKPKPPYTGTRVGFSSLWLDGEVTLRFVEDVLGEVADLTPGPYLHVGGDEAFATDPADYLRFIDAVQDIVRGLDKTLIGWEEIGRAPLRSPAICQFWRDPQLARAAVRRGARVISSPSKHAYLDMAYAPDFPLGTLWAGPISVEQAYDWDPAFDGIGESDILGVEAPLWTETAATFDDLARLAFPRLPGHAEIAWSPAAGRTWAAYHRRLALHGARMDRWGLAYHPSPDVAWAKDTPDQLPGQN